MRDPLLHRRVELRNQLRLNLGDFALPQPRKRVLRGNGLTTNNPLSGPYQHFWAISKQRYIAYHCLDHFFSLLLLAIRPKVLKLG